MDSAPKNVLGAADYSVRMEESPGNICLPQARSTNSPTQLPFIPKTGQRSVPEALLISAEMVEGLIFLDLLIQPVSLAFRGESGQEVLNEPREACVICTAGGSNF